MTKDRVLLDADHRYWLNPDEGRIQVHGYSEICRELGVTKDNPFHTEQGRREGVALHSWLNHLVHGKSVAEPPHPSIAGRVRGIQKFIKDTRFKIAGGEAPQYEPRLRYACTPDLWGHIGAFSWVIDAKRGAYMPTHALQTAAQRIALAANGFRAQKRGALYLRDNDYRLVEHPNHINEAHWKALVAGYHAMTPEERVQFAAGDIDGMVRDGTRYRTILSAFHARKYYIPAAQK